MMITHKLLSIENVLDATGFKKSTMYRWISEGRFPKPIKIGNSRSSRWIDKDVEQWINEQISSHKGSLPTTASS